MKKRMEFIMIDKNSREISDEMYHRVYRLIKRKVNPHTIAATVHLPVRTIYGVISKIQRNENIKEPVEEAVVPQEVSQQSKEFLDTYFYPKTRFAILDLVGVLSDACDDKIRGEMDKLQASSWKAIAIRMSDVSSISKSICDIIVECKEKLSSSGRFLAILDPASEIEQTLVEYNIESIIPIFGTESAFEDAAFAVKGKSFTRRGSQSR